jgi:hypothetical protein
MTEIASKPLRDRLLEPIKAYGDRKFRVLSLVEQHEILFRFIEETYEEVMEVKELLQKMKGIKE